MVNQVMFEWDDKKNQSNFEKHGVHFEVAQYAFADRHRIILEDIDHSSKDENRYFCIGKIENEILTVRFTYRKNKIRILGAGFWRKGKKIYEEK